MCPVLAHKEYSLRRPTAACTPTSHFYLQPLRKPSAVQALLNAEVPPTSVMQLTGHKNVQSLNSYSSLSLPQQQMMSNTLSSLLPNQHKPMPAASTSAIEKDTEVIFDVSGLDEVWDGLDGLGDATVNLFAPTNVAQACEVSPVGAIELDIHKCMTSHFSADTSKPPVFKFLNGMINGNVTINFGNTSAKGQSD